MTHLEKAIRNDNPNELKLLLDLHYAEENENSELFRYLDNSRSL